MNELLRRAMWFLLGLFAVLLLVFFYIWISVTVQDKNLERVKTEMRNRRSRQDSILQLVLTNQDSIKRELDKIYEERK